MVGTFPDPVGTALGSSLQSFQLTATVNKHFLDDQVAVLDPQSFVLGLPVGNG